MGPRAREQRKKSLEVAVSMVNSRETGFSESGLMTKRFTLAYYRKVWQLAGVLA
jgi:hypothetical protein